MRPTAGSWGCLGFALALGACALSPGGNIGGSAGDEDVQEPGLRMNAPGADAAGPRAEIDPDDPASEASDAGVARAGTEGGRLPSVPPPLAAQDIRPVLTVATKSLLDESFETDTWKKAFSLYKADATVVNGELRFGSVPGAGHPPQAGFRLRSNDFAMQFRFRLEGSATLALQMSNATIRAHVAYMSIGTRGVNLSRMTGWGGTTKIIRLARSEITIEKGRTYTALFELQGDEMALQIDGRCFVYARAPELAAQKTNLYLTGSGTYTFYDDVRVWQTMPNPSWPTRKEETLAAGLGCR